MSMKQERQPEPPSCSNFPRFKVGQDSHGNWVAQESSGLRGGLFVDLAQALRFVRAENGYRSRGVLMVSDVLELDMKQVSAVRHHQQSELAGHDQRRVA
jgi:hypothetical protein